MRQFPLRSQHADRRGRLTALALVVAIIICWRIQVASEQSPLGFPARARKLCSQVDELRRAVAELEANSLTLEEQARERVRLMGLLAERDRVEAAGLRALPARVIGEVSHGGIREVIVDHGRRHRVRRHDVLTAAAGLVGIVTEADDTISRAMLLTDRRSGVPVCMEPSAPRASDAATPETHYGIVYGGRDDGLLWLGYLAPDAGIATADEVWTSGLGELYPPKILVGRVSGSVITDPAPARAAVVPAVKWSQLREVLVVHSASK